MAKTKSASLKKAKSISRAAKKSRASKITTTRARPASRTAPLAKRKSRSVQRVAVSHLQNANFAAGLRAYAHYRDLGIAEATHGAAQAHVIRLIGPCNPKKVSKLHFHDIEFQMVYVLKGWVKTYLEGEGEVMMREGSCWTQPPKIKHLIRDYSDNCELLEIILPAEFKTVEL